MRDSLNFNVGILDNLYWKFIDILPKILFFIVFLLIAWIAYKLILLAVKGVLKLIKVDALEGKLNDNELVEKLNIKIRPSKIILSFVKWFLILALIIIGAEMLNLHAISEETGHLISYLPQFFTALVIFIIGIYFANFIKRSIYNLLKSIDLNGSKLISLLIFYFLVIMVTISALNQAGVNTEIVTNNLFLIIGAFLAAFTIAFGLGSRDIVYRLLLGFYSKKNIQIGDRIKIGKIQGTVLSIDNISLVLKFEETKIVVPIKDVCDKKIEILD